MRPLPGYARRQARPLWDEDGIAPAPGNRGLAYEKYGEDFGNGWRLPEPIRGRRTTKLEELGGKAAWVARAAAGSPVAAQAHRKAISNRAERLRRLAQSLPHHRRFAAKVVGGLAIGLGIASPVENGFLFDFCTGEPYLPGSSLKGLMRAWAQEWEGVPAEDPRLLKLLGADLSDIEENSDPDSSGALIVFDARPLSPCSLMRDIITPHHSEYQDDEKAQWPGDWQSPKPIPHLSVAAGAEFGFAVALRPGVDAGADELDAASGWLQSGLEHLGIGARTSRGYGRFSDFTLWK